jgi:F420-non-reducing hydrogenase iron-sulfur subunit
MADRAVKLLTFMCNWCSYGGADAAGGKRLEHPAGVRFMRVMCSGRIDPQLVIEAFRAGADGVLVLGCHPGDCHYKEGNYRARNRVELLRPMLAQFGIASERLSIEWVGAAEGDRFQEVVNAAYATITALGPLELGPTNSRARASASAPALELELSTDGSREETPQ